MYTFIRKLKLCTYMNNCVHTYEYIYIYIYIYQVPGHLRRVLYNENQNTLKSYILMTDAQQHAW